MGKTAGIGGHRGHALVFVSLIFVTMACECEVETGEGLSKGGRDDEPLSLRAGDEVTRILCDTVRPERLEVLYLGALSTGCEPRIALREQPSGEWLIREQVEGHTRIWCQCRVSHRKPDEAFYTFALRDKVAFLSIIHSGKQFDEAPLGLLKTQGGVHLDAILSRVNKVAEQRNRTGDW